MNVSPGEILGLLPGHRVRYHTGNLAFDRKIELSVHLAASMAMAMEQEGTVDLYQIRAGDFRFEYWVRRRFAKARPCRWPTDPPPSWHRRRA